MFNFIPFIATVVDAYNDPEKNGRVKIRPLSENYNNVLEDELPWASIMLPPTSASKEGIGISPGGLENGSFVLGFYLDGETKTKPMIMGSMALPKRMNTGNDLNELFKDNKIIQKTKLDNEPDSKANPQYPYNKVFKSKSGHVIEIDDTPANERIHIFHKNGSYIEISQDGDIVTKSINNNVEVIAKDKDIFVNNGDLNIKVSDGSFILESKDLNIKSNDIKINANGFTLQTSKEMKIQSSSKISLLAPLISLLGKISIGK